MMKTMFGAAGAAAWVAARANKTNQTAERTRTREGSFMVTREKACGEFFNRNLDNLTTYSGALADSDVLALYSPPTASTWGSVTR